MTINSVILWVSKQKEIVMGLDMYAFKTKFTPDSEVDFNVPESEESEQIYYWRKHPNLHGWLENLYQDKKGQHEFNCVNVKITAEDLSDLRSSIGRKELPSTSGFFFGQSNNSDEEKEHDLVFVKLAEQALDEGYNVYYTSSW